jgi:hypothetical protein
MTAHADGFVLKGVIKAEYSSFSFKKRELPIDFKAPFHGIL